MYKKKKWNYLIIMLLAVFFVSFKTSAAVPEDIASQLTYLQPDGASTGYENAIQIGDVIYSYMEETDSFCVCSLISEKTDAAGELQIESYILGRPVTKISPDFQASVRTMTLPETLTEPVTFSDNNMLEVLVFPSHMENPGEVSRMYYLRNVVLPKEAVTSGKFSSCVSLKYIDLPSTIKVIEENAFSGCVRLKEAAIPDGVVEIGKGAFSGCKNLKLYVPKSVKKIGENAFGTKTKGKVKLLYCVKNSAAHKYAKKNKIPYELVSAKGSTRKIQKLQAEKKELIFEIGDRDQLEVKAVPFYASNTALLYSSSNPEIMSIDKNGEMKALAAGKAVVTVRAAANKKKKAKVTVYVSPEQVEEIYFTCNYEKERTEIRCAEVQGAHGYELWQCSKKDGKYTRVKMQKKKKFNIAGFSKKYYKVRAYIKYGKKVVYGEFSPVARM